jgi:hypothetical protein
MPLKEDTYNYLGVTTMSKLPHKALVAVREVMEGQSLCTFECPISGIQKMEMLPVDYKNIIEWIDGKLIQNAMPNLTDDERELFLTAGLI